MKPIKFPEHTTVLAEDQPEYLPLPVMAWGDREGTVTSCWQLSWWERMKLMFTGKVWLSQMTFGTALQPQMPTTYKPFVMSPEDEYA